MLQMQQALVPAGLSLQDAPAEPIRRPASQLHGGSTYFALHHRAPKPPVLLVPHRGWAHGHLRAVTPAPLPRQRPPMLRRWLPVRLSGRSGGQGSRASHSSVRGLRQPGSALASCGNGLLPLLFFFVCLFACSFIKNCSSSKNKN